MNTRAGKITVVDTACACALGLASLLAVGCGAPWMLEYQDQFTRYRVDNPDGDNLWDTGDVNGNGEIDNDEAIGPAVDFDQMHDASPSNESNIPQVNFANSSFVTGSIQPIFRGTHISFGSGVGGIVDDLDGDSTSGFIGNTRVILVDFDDVFVFSLFSPFAGQMDQRAKVQVQGMQIVRALRFSNHEEVKDTDQTEHFLEISSGARYFRLQDRYYFENPTLILEGFVADTSMDNVSFGPQFGLRWGSSNRNWDFAAEGFFLLGYNRIDGSQTGQFGELRIPGALNTAARGQPTRFSNQQDGEDFSPIGEVRASASYQLTETLAVRLGYSAFYVSNLQYAEDAVDWSLPNMGITIDPDQDWFTATLYANIELLR